MRHDYCESPTKAEGTHQFSESPSKPELTNHDVLQVPSKAEVRPRPVKMPQDSKRNILQISDRIIEGTYD
jgi:hypothetical protein